MDPETSRRWRWNPALRVVREKRGGRDVAVLHDPQHDEYYQLGLTEFELARAFEDGRDLESVRQSVTARGQEPPSLGDLAAFAAQLAESNLLLPTDDGTVSVAPAARRALWRRLLAIRIAAVHPEAFFARFAPPLRFLFGTPALVAGAALVLGASWIAAGAWGTYRLELRTGWSGPMLAVTWLLYGIVILVHELAHGFACAHFGGRVRAMGFLLLYGKPCAYCDVSDAWLLPKSARLWIMAAGSLVEIVLWAVATLVWWLTAPATLWHRGAVVVMAISGVGTLFNLNPLLKFDGYYMLSDSLEIPNLRQRAFHHLGRCLLGRPREPATARERRVFWIYGVAALVYSTLVLGWLVVRLHGWMAGTWGSLGAWLFWVAAGAVAVRPVLRLIRGAFGWLRSRLRGTHSRAG